MDRSPSQSSSLRILANLMVVTSPCFRGDEPPCPTSRDSMNRPTLIPRHLATSHHQGDPDRVHAGSPQRFANHVLRVRRRSTKLSKRAHGGIDSTRRRDRPERLTLKRAKLRPLVPRTHGRRRTAQGGPLLTSVLSGNSSLVTLPLRFASASSPATRIILTASAWRSMVYSRKIATSQKSPGFGVESSLGKDR